MAKKKVVTTSRGVKLDMDALKASQPNSKRLVVNQIKEREAEISPKTVIPTIRKARIHAVVPAAIPTEQTLLTFATDNSETKSEPPTGTSSHKKHKSRD